MKEFALDAMWLMIAILCITISINAIINSIDERIKKKQRNEDIEKFKEWLNSLEDVNKK